MSPTCVVSNFPHQPSGWAPSITAAGAVDTITLSSQPIRQTNGVPGWVQPLVALRDQAIVRSGTAEELCSYQEFVKRCISDAASRVASLEADLVVASLQSQLSRSMELCRSNRAVLARNAAVQLLGFAELAQQLTYNNSNATHKGAHMSVYQPTATAGAGGAGAAGAGTPFKVPALPAKRQRSPEQQQQKQEAPVPAPAQTSSQLQPSQAEQQLQWRHSTPKRRATPQVLAAGPCSITPAAPPASGMHGEACCDEQLLSSWCPISGKRQKLLPADDDYATDSDSQASDSSQDTTAALQPQPQPEHVQQQPPLTRVLSWSSSSSSGSGGSPPPSTAHRAQQQQQQQQPMQAQQSGLPPLPPKSGSAVASARSGAVQSLKQLMHEDPAAKPAADVLLFNKEGQLPIVNWSGTIKHRAQGQVVELCKLSLQVPEAYLEEFPAALYAADIRHRRSVSLGRHVVCRANLAALSEHQLASLAAMARSQLVALCSLQTAELHLVPYFDNRNVVRLVGFLKIKSTL